MTDDYKPIPCEEKYDDDEFYCREFIKYLSRRGLTPDCPYCADEKPKEEIYDSQDKEKKPKIEWIVVGMPPMTLSPERIKSIEYGLKRRKKRILKNLKTNLFEDYEPC